ALELALAVGTLSLGLLAVVGFAKEPAAVVLVAIVAALLYAAYRGYNSLQHRYGNLQQFYGFTKALARSAELGSAVETTLNEAREVLRARGAEVCLFPADGDPSGMRVRVSGGNPVATTVLVGQELADLRLSD